MQKLIILVLFFNSILYVQGSVVPERRNFLRKQTDPRCKEDGVFAISNDCTSYLVCSNGLGRVRNCPDDLRFDSIEYCTRKENADCGVVILEESFKATIEPLEEGICDLPPETGPCRGSFLAFYYDRETHGCKEFRYGGCGGNANNFPDEDSCMASCFASEEEDNSTDEFYCKENGTFANPYSCDSFFECSAEKDIYVSRKIQCPQDQHYSTETKQCEDKCSAKCDQTLEICKPHPDFVCSWDGMYSYLGDCESYHECSNGRAFRKHCHHGLHFSQETFRCEMPCNAKCDQEFACECGWSLCSNFSEITIPDTSHEIYCSEDGLHPVVKECSKYVDCSDHKGFYINCPLGLHFNAATLRCETPCTARCDPDIPCFMEERLCSNGKCFQCPLEEGEFSDLYDCSVYHECRNGSSRIFSCPPGKLFDHRRAQCLKKDKALCVYVCEELNAMYKHPLDAYSYILCQQGIPIVKRCSDGSIFQDEARECVKAETAEPVVNGIFDLFQMGGGIWDA